MATQTAPIRPETTNGPLQLSAFASQTVSGGARTAPRLAPPMAIPIASAATALRERLGDGLQPHREAPPSPIPRRNRQTPSCQALHATACRALAPDQSPTASAIRTASARSITRPPTEHHRVAGQEGGVDVPVRGVRHLQPHGRLRGKDGGHLPVEEAQPGGDEEPAAEPPRIHPVRPPMLIAVNLWRNWARCRGSVSGAGTAHRAHGARPHVVHGRATVPPVQPLGGIPSPLSAIASAAPAITA